MCIRDRYCNAGVDEYSIFFCAYIITVAAASTGKAYKFYFHPNLLNYKKAYAQWLAEQTGNPTWKTPIRQDVDAAIAASLTWNQFLRALERQGYGFQFDRKYPTLILPGTGRTVRFKTLGKQYTPEALQRRILYPKLSPPAGKEHPPARRPLLLLGKKPSRRLTGLRALYFSYLYKVGALPKKPRYMSYAVREDIRKLDQRIEQAEFIFKNHIENRAQLSAIRQKAEDEITVLLKERQKLYRYQPGSPQIGVLTERLKKQRHIVKLCRNIETHSVEMEQRLQAARLEEQRRKLQEQEKQQKETRNRENKTQTLS